nr:hypothetical protein [Tanacetum cinerariifolium]
RLRFNKAQGGRFVAGKGGEGWGGCDGGGETYGGNFGFECYSSCYSNGGEDGSCYKFGRLTILVPPLVRDYHG